MREMGAARRFSAAALATLAAAACGSGDRRGAPPAIRLVDLFTAKNVEGGTAAAATALPRIEWRFDGTAPAPPASPSATTRGFDAGPSVAGLSVRDGLLVGRSTDDFPLVHVERTSGLDNPDQVHTIEVRMRASAGANLWVQTLGDAPVDFLRAAALGRRQPWPNVTPIVAGDETKTYAIVPGFPLMASTVRHLLIRPTDAANASFAIESVRIVTRKEHLAGIPTGVGFQGLRQVFKESLVSRSPETLRFDVRLPARPWLDLSVGTVEEVPATFRVSVRPEGGGEELAGTVRTVTTAHRWEPLALDLSTLAGRRVTVGLSLESEHAGTVGFWGAPVVRANQPTPRGRPRGVILVQTDTLRRDHLEAYGHGRPTAPGLTRLAKEGVRFAHTFSQASWTKVSSTSILTSLYPPTHGVLEFNDRLPASATTIAEVYREHGYATLSLSSVPFTGQATNLQQGFEELHEGAPLTGRGAYPSKTARASVDRAQRWLEERKGAPFFMYLHVFDPHSPYEPYAPYDRLWVDAETRARHVRDKGEAVKRIRDPFLRVREMPNRREVAEAGFDPAAYMKVEQDWYDASIRGMDVELSRLLEWLRATGREADTIVLVTSDHGTEFHEHGDVFHGQGVYGELTNVPLIVSWPGRIARGRVVDEVVQSIDVMPTLLDLSGLPSPKEAQGRSLRPFLETAPPSAAFRAEWSSRPAVSHRVPNGPNQPPPRDRVAESIVDGPWKLVRSHTPGYPEFELYEWKTDPLDQKDVASGNPEVVTRLTRALDAWRASAESARLPSDAESTKDLDPEALERLRALGYVR